MALTRLDVSTLYKQPPPPFGHPLRNYFALDREYVNLNHGSYGSTPLPVLQAANDLTLQIERNPDHFLRLLYQPILDGTRERLANLIGAKANEVVLVANASLGVNTILRNFEWAKDDTLIVTTSTYGSVYKTAFSISDSSPNPKVSVFNLKFPTTHAEIISNFREHIRSLPKPEGSKRVAVIDSIVSNPGVLLPWKELVKICKEEGVWSLVDAAHSIGQEVGINLTEAAPDFWISAYQITYCLPQNAHKWLYAKRSCAVLYVPERNQHIVKTSIPTSHTYISPKDRKGPNFVEQFEWNGTIDFVPYLTVPAALDFRNWLGGEEKINNYCHSLALEGGQRLAKILGTRVIDPNGDLTMNMVNVELPFPGTILWSLEIDRKLKQKLLEERKMYSAHFYHNGKWWTRCSAQIYTELTDFEKLGKAWLEVIKEVQDELEKKLEA
ncbi:pyridoxal phosphate-dependent transferase [Crucibulum laeve]|uniref:Pyridoxal phosphate-dependent transferase n=1 Tax=Crucibulum laeve TaxID=68775 RepID=A0A5C3LX57_9AGAR|nr:pyridoxal phosphate-dependent transferase [Crucibulum laeve]